MFIVRHKKTAIREIGDIVLTLAALPVVVVIWTTSKVLDTISNI